MWRGGVGEEPPTPQPQRLVHRPLYITSCMAANM